MLLHIRYHLTLVSPSSSEFGPRVLHVYYRLSNTTQQDVAIYGGLLGIASLSRSQLNRLCISLDGPGVVLLEVIVFHHVLVNHLLTASCHIHPPDLLLTTILLACAMGKGHCNGLLQQFLEILSPRASEDASYP